MRRFYEGNDNKGYQEVVDKEAGLELIGFDLIRLEPGENAVYESEEYEIGLVILQGTCSVKVDDVTFDKLGSRRRQPRRGAGFGVEPGKVVPVL